MISDDKMKHILGVARKAYNLAKLRGHNEDYAWKMWLLGYLHDIGYEFAISPEVHAITGAKMYLRLPESTTPSDQNDPIFLAIKEHGDPDAAHQSEEWLILNQADRLIDSTGKEVGYDKRLQDIRTYYGESSLQYQNAVKIVEIIKDK